MEVDRADGRTANQRRPVVCTRGVLHRAHGSASWAQGETKVIAAVYGPKAGTKKNENPEKACIEVIWKPKTGQSGKQEREYEMVLKKTLQSICLLNVHPNTTTSIVIQLRYVVVWLKVDILFLTPNMKAFIYLVFPNSIISVLPDGSKRPGGEAMEHGIVTSLTHGVMAVDEYFSCVKLGRAAAAELSDFVRNSLKLKAGNDPSKAG
ncbi:putative ribosomal protein S5 domain 2-type [Helianthus annuus]|nr:putative ribosomal protein S5 domain 2-type [Helianthus annuus]